MVVQDDGEAPGQAGTTSPRNPPPARPGTAASPAPPPPPIMKPSTSTTEARPCTLFRAIRKGCGDMILPTPHRTFARKSESGGADRGRSRPPELSSHRRKSCNACLHTFGGRQPFSTSRTPCRGRRDRRPCQPRKTRGARPRR
jgi:hypothetical protein